MYYTWIKIALHIATLILKKDDNLYTKTAEESENTIFYSNPNNWHSWPIIWTKAAKAKRQNWEIAKDVVAPATIHDVLLTNFMSRFSFMLKSLEKLVDTYRYIRDHILQVFPLSDQQYSYQPGIFTHLAMDN